MWKVKKEHAEIVVTVHIQWKYARCAFAHRSLNTSALSTLSLFSCAVVTEYYGLETVIFCTEIWSVSNFQETCQPSAITVLTIHQQL